MAIVFLRYLVWAKGVHRGAGYRIFFLGTIALLFSWWMMGRADLRHLREQEDLCAQDPKHLFDNSAGLRVNPRERTGIILSLMVMGAGLLIQAFPIGHIGMIFWGAGLCLIAASIWALT
jgi:hypothetical protein